MSEEKRAKMNGTSPETESSSPRTREAVPASPDGLWLLGERPDHLKEDRVEAGEESETVGPITWRRGGQRGNASRALTAGEDCSRYR